MSHRETHLPADQIASQPLVNEPFAADAVAADAVAADAVAAPEATSAKPLTDASYQGADASYQGADASYRGDAAADSEEATSSLQRFAGWIDAQLIILEEQQSRFVTDRSMLKSLRR